VVGISFGDLGVCGHVAGVCSWGSTVQGSTVQYRVKNKDTIDSKNENIILVSSMRSSTF